MTRSELICSWLGLPPGGWPPDHYALLGLPAGSEDAEGIEREVQRRLEIVRRYQLTHPEQATEAMNRIAQALVCLTDPAAKAAYDAKLLSPVASPPVTPPAGGAVDGPGPADWLPDPDRADARPQDILSPSAKRPTVVDWDTAFGDEHLPPPEVVEAVPAATAAEGGPGAAGEVDPITAEAAGGPPAPAAEADPVLEAARLPAFARRGLGTKRAFYHRLAHTRRLVRAWERAGLGLADPAWRVSRPAEATELIDRLKSVRESLRGFPPILGKAGQPGYLVLALARQQVIVPTFQTLLPSQREALARDWAAGRKLLSAHLTFLRQELRRMRHKAPWRWAVRATAAFFTDRPGLLLLLLALLALNVAVWRSYFRGPGPNDDRPPARRH